MINIERREMIYLIEWRNNLKGYFYGTSFHFKGRGWVTYENNLMPPGTMIQRWKSDYNYQANRHEPELVPLREGEEYCLQAYWSCEPEGRLFLRAIFYDSRGKLLSSATEFGPVFTFTCPKGCCSWELQLINGGVRRFELNYIAFANAKTLEHPWFRDRKAMRDPVLIFGEPQGNTIVCPAPNLLNRIDNTVFLPVQYAETMPMLERVISPLLTKKTLLIGYGPRGNRVTSALAKAIGCSGFMCWDKNEAPPEPTDPHLHFYISRPLPNARRQTHLPLIRGMVDYTHRLQDFPFDLLP